MAEPFWRTKTLDEMSSAEWEALCDGCGRCCLNKLEDIETGEIGFTVVACRLLDAGTCRCKDYEKRFAKVPDCLSITPEMLDEVTWLPPTCAYRLVAEGRDLFWWHHLVCGDADAVHRAGVSVRGRIVSETEVAVERYEERLEEWPGQPINGT